jgi:hypothetical protein
LLGEQSRLRKPPLVEERLHLLVVRGNREGIRPVHPEFL